MKALDLFCGAGGATKGLQLAGCHVTGVDIAPQPHYCGDEFHQADALTFPLEGFDLIWASPPCQAYSASTLALRNAGKTYPDLIAAVRDRLRSVAVGAAYVIENVVGAPLINPTLLCGTMFGLPLLRHRLFETSWALGKLIHPCHHTGDEIPVYGHGTPSWYKSRARYQRNFTTAQKRAAMGIEWMTRDELSQAIPPAYSEWIGHVARREILMARASRAHRRTA